MYLELTFGFLVFFNKCVWLRVLAEKNPSKFLQDVEDLVFFDTWRLPLDWWCEFSDIQVELDQDMRWVSTRTFQLLLTPSNLQQFSLNAFLCNQSNFSETKLFFITLGRSCQMCFRTLKQWASKKKTFQITSVCVLLITYKYIYARV